MKGIIVYKGRYGATEQYAKWLEEELKVPAFSAENIWEEFAKYNFLIIGSSVYIGKLEIRKWLKKNFYSISFLHAQFMRFHIRKKRSQAKNRCGWAILTKAGLARSGDYGLIFTCVPKKIL